MLHRLSTMFLIDVKVWINIKKCLKIRKGIELANNLLFLARDTTLVFMFWWNSVISPHLMPHWNKLVLYTFIHLLYFLLENNKIAIYLFKIVTLIQKILKVVSKCLCMILCHSLRHIYAPCLLHSMHVAIPVLVRRCVSVCRTRSRTAHSWRVSRTTTRRSAGSCSCYRTWRRPPSRTPAVRACLYTSSDKYYTTGTGRDMAYGGDWEM